MAQNIATTAQIDDLVELWIKQGRFAKRSEAYRAGIFALKPKLDAEAFDPDFVTIVRELDRHPGGADEPGENDLSQTLAIAKKHRRK